MSATTQRHPTKMPATYRDVAAFIITGGNDVRRVDLEPAFPSMSPRQLSKALENACTRGLIHSVARGQYRAGQKPATPVNESAPYAAVSASVTRNASPFSPETINTSLMINGALDNLSAIERAWFSVVGRPTQMTAYTAA